MNQKIILAGGAGLVGQNLIVRLKQKGYSNMIVLDKHQANLKTLQELHPELTTQTVDLSDSNSVALWQHHFKNADAVVMLQAQIGGLNYDEFVHNNVDSTRLILDVATQHQVPYVVHISSSVVKSVADDFYTRSKIAQEKLVLEHIERTGLACPILRPTLMFGWFDRKHLGWLSRLMKKTPVFPIPGNGRFMRQPLYVGDFCNIIIACIEQRVQGGIYNISGHEKIDYVDMIHSIKRAIKSRTWVVHIPFRLFYALLWLWAKFDKKPPFTTQQLEALIAKDEFEVIDWPNLFGVPYTPFEAAINETFNDPRYGSVVLEF